jgi:hypothetical protein
VTETADLPGLPGQGGINNPPGEFFNHFITKYAKQFYDPSYGTGPKSASEWENLSVAGFRNTWNSIELAAKNNTSVKEMDFNDLDAPAPVH